MAAGTTCSGAAAGRGLSRECSDSKQVWTEMLGSRKLPKIDTIRSLSLNACFISERSQIGQGISWGKCNTSQTPYKFRINFWLWSVLIIFIVLHLSHVSSFYTIKTYMEAVEVGKIRANFKTINQT